MATEEFKVSGGDIMSTIKRIIAAGNARKIIIKNESGEGIVEFPLTVGAVGVLLAPLFAAVGTLTALVANCTIVVEKRDDTKPAAAESTESEPASAE